MKKIVGAVSLLMLLTFVFAGQAWTQLWAVRNLTRAYFGLSSDAPVPAHYSFQPGADIAVFRPSGGLWSIRNFTRAYFGSSSDYPIPSDYSGDGLDDIAIFRGSTGMWSVRNFTRFYFGNSSDQVVSGQGAGDFNGDGTADPGIFRPATSLWAIRNLTRAYYGQTGDLSACGDYDGDGTTDLAVFRPGSSLWAVRGVTRRYFGVSTDELAPGYYDGDDKYDVGIFRPSAGLWAILNVTRMYFGRTGDWAVPRDYSGDRIYEAAIFRGEYIGPSPSPYLLPSPSPSAMTSPSPSPSAPPAPSPSRSPSPSPIPSPSPSPISGITPAPGIPIYNIQHNGVTGSVTVTGNVCLVYPSMGFFLADDSGPYNGIYVNQSTYGPDIGYSVTLTGAVSSSAGKTLIQNLSAYAVNSKNNAPYGPVTVAASAVTQEQYEGCLVKVEDALSVTNQNSGSGKWVVTGSGSPVTLDDELDYNYFPRTGDQFTSIVGVVERSTSQSPNQWLQPRFTADLEAPKTVIPHYALKGDVVTMDDSRHVYDNYYIEVKGDLVQGVTPNAPSGVDVIDVNGLIFPGMISTHNHPDYDLWDFIPFSLPPYFRERNDWAKDAYGGSMYHDFKVQRNAFSDYYDEITKLSEVRLATSGCTVIQGRGSGISHSQDVYAKLGVGIINGDRFPGRTENVVLAPQDENWTTHHNNAVRGKLHRYLIHLGETTDAGPTQAGQWNWWKSQVAFDGYDTLIHGINIPAAEYALFDHGVDSFGDPLKTVISWACKSNVLLYDETANIRGALDQGATVALAPDWTESGMPNMLAELNYCKYISDQNAWNVQSRQFVEMATRNAAAGFGQLNRMGTIEAGKMANLMVIADGPGDPYDDFLLVAGGGAAYDYRCGPQDVKLTVVAGRPIYGDPSLLNVSNFPSTYGASIEDITICGTPKKLSLARYNGGAYSGVDALFNNFYQELWTMYCNSSQYPCAFLPYDPAGVMPPTPVPTPSPPPGTFIIKIGTDDASQHVSFYVDNAAYVYFGRHSVSDGYYAGFRFQNVNIPPGTAITGARLVLTQYTDYASPQPPLLVAAHDVDNSPTFSSGNGPLDRKGALTTAQVAWTPGPGTINVEFQSPDISGIVQEIVNRGGWVSGNALSIILSPNEASVDHRRRAWAYDGAPAKAARLEVEWASGPTPSPTPTVTPTPVGYETPTPSPTATPSPTPSPTPVGFETPVPTPSPGNLIRNPGFELWTTETQPQDWLIESAALLERESGTVHSGSYSAKVSTLSASNTGTYSEITGIEGDQPYTMTAWLYSYYSADDLRTYVNWYEVSDPDWIFIRGSYSANPVSAGVWAQVWVNDTAPSNASGAQAKIRGYRDSSLCGYADDAEFFKQ